ncbi:MAG: PD-(D/E)XK nuclease family protein [Bdellovibrionales bacterium]|nr:PD-(D/E)XK nuclease family protein [Bdellovibrionales bacterium]
MISAKFSEQLSVNTQIVSAIHTVVTKLSVHSESHRTSIYTSTPSNKSFELITSIEKLKKALLEKSFSREKDPSPNNNRALLQAIRECSLTLVRGLKMIPPPSKPQLSIFESIHRPFDENLHSDCIARILDPLVTGTFAKLFLSAIARETEIPDTLNSMVPIHSRREIRLDRVDPKLLQSEIGDRRIDILLETSTFVLIFENKVHSSESVNQTKDYYEAVYNAYSTDSAGHKNVYGILLSPDGSIPDSGNFRVLTYWQLYQILHQTCKDHSDGLKSDFLEFYINELYSIFIKPRLIAIDEINKYWEKIQNG